MAEKFNDGDSLESIRLKVNDAVDELNLVPENYVNRTEYERVKKAVAALPFAITEQPLPAGQAGYYGTVNNGAFSPNGTYVSYTLLLANYSTPIYVSGQVRDSGTALAFYYDDAGALISFQFQGGASIVTYDKQLLTIPNGTAKINITVLSAGTPAKIYSQVTRTDILSKTEADVLYISPTTADGRYASSTLTPIVQKLNEVFPKSVTLQPSPQSQAGFYRVDNGGFTANPSYLSYTLMVSNYSVPIYISGQMKDVGTALAFYYNAAGAFLGYQARGTSDTVTYDRQPLTLPAGTTKINITVLAAGGAAKIYSQSIAEDILAKSTADGLYVSAGLIPLVKVEQSLPIRQVGFYNVVGTPGSFTANATYYSYTLNVVNYILPIYVSGQMKDAGTALAFFYDSSGALLGYQDRGTASTVTYTKRKLILPVGTAKINITVLAAGGDAKIYADGAADILSQSFGDSRYQLKQGTGLPIASPKQVKFLLALIDIIQLYGTSISSTDYSGYKQAMADLTGAVVRNDGVSGATASSLAKNANLQRIWDNNAKLVVIEIGANDAGASGTVGTFGANTSEPSVQETDINIDYNGTYFIQAVSHVIRKFKAQYYNIRQRANLIGTETEAEKQAKIDAVLKPYLVFTTGFPQKRTNASSAFSNPENWMRKRDAIVECCNRYDIHCIDTMNLLGIDWSLEPYWPGTTDKNTNYGVYTMDGLHFNKYGYELLSRIVCGGVGTIQLK